VADRPLSAEELAAREREALRALIRWFDRRCPTPRERLASARQAWLRAARRVPR
jgi:hypothetical protein